MEFIKKRDKFGHQVQFKFDNGNSHNTLCGGLLSICVNIFMLAYVLSNVKKWILMEDDSIQTIVKQIEPKDLGVVLLNETGILPFIAILDIS